ncbi:MAG TPA: porin family protein [Phenylobacterium sp.]|nr:porin family protein [Phenylobacterium sp.]
MKTLIALSVATLAASAAIPAVAAAQDAAGTSYYGTLGYGASSVEGVDLGAIQGRLGVRFGQHLGVEGELAAGVKDDKTYVGGVPVKIDLEHQAAIYGVGYLPVAPNADLFARVGYGTTKLKASASGASVSDAGDSWNYGVGGQYLLDGANGVRADYTRYDFKDSSANADVWSVAYVRKF